jgi:hypothetical protein
MHERSRKGAYRMQHCAPLLVAIPLVHAWRQAGDAVPSSRVPRALRSMPCRLTSSPPPAGLDEAEIALRGNDHMIPCHHPDQLGGDAQALRQICVLD